MGIWANCEGLVDEAQGIPPIVPTAVVLGAKAPATAKKYMGHLRMHWKGAGQKEALRS